MKERSLLERYKRGVFVGVGAGALFYLIYSLSAELPKVLEALETFRWILLVPILLLSFANYFVRFLRWEYYLRRLDIRVHWKESFTIFMAGLSMTITPGKAGELLKSLLLRECAGTPLTRSASVIVAERLTDFLALIFLTALGIGTWYSRHRSAVLVVGLALVSIVLVLNSEKLSLGMIRSMEKLPVIGRFAHHLEEPYRSTAALLHVGPLAVGLFLSTVAWFAECLGYYVVINGHGVEASVFVSTFLYAFSTIAGVVSPGGLGVTDLSLGEGARRLIPGITPSLSVSAAFVIRLCTLWFAVLVGSIALMRFKGKVEPATVEMAAEGIDDG